MVPEGLLSGNIYSVEDGMDAQESRHLEAA